MERLESLLEEGAGCRAPGLQREPSPELSLRGAHPHPPSALPGQLDGSLCRHPHPDSAAQTPRDKSFLPTPSPPLLGPGLSTLPIRPCQLPHVNGNCLFSKMRSSRLGEKSGEMALAPWWGARWVGPGGKS